MTSHSADVRKDTRNAGNARVGRRGHHGDQSGRSGGSLTCNVIGIVLSLSG